MEDQKQPRKVKTRVDSKPKVRKIKVPTATGQEAIDAKIEEWHNSKSKQPLHEFLGMTEEAYKNWLTGKLPTPEGESAGEATKIGESTENKDHIHPELGEIDIPKDFTYDEVLFQSRFEQLKEFGVTKLEDGNLSYEDETISPRQLMYNNQNPTDWELLLNQFRSAAFDKLTPQQQMDKAIDLALTRIKWTRTVLIKGKFPKKGFTFFLARWSGGQKHQAVLRNGRKVGTQMVPIKNEAWYEVSLAEIERLGADKIQRHMTGELIKQGAIKP
jgi:hypothetical protein